MTERDYIIQITLDLNRSGFFLLRFIIKKKECKYQNWSLYLTLVPLAPNGKTELKDHSNSAFLVNLLPVDVEGIGVVVAVEAVVGAKKKNVHTDVNLYKGLRFRYLNRIKTGSEMLTYQLF